MVTACRKMGKYKNRASWTTRLARSRSPIITQKAAIALTMHPDEWVDCTVCVLCVCVCVCVCL